MIKFVKTIRSIVTNDKDFLKRQMLDLNSTKECTAIFIFSITIMSLRPLLRKGDPNTLIGNMFRELTVFTFTALVFISIITIMAKKIDNSLLGRSSSLIQNYHLYALTSFWLVIGNIIYYLFVLIGSAILPFHIIISMIGISIYGVIIADLTKISTSVSILLSSLTYIIAILTSMFFFAIVVELFLRDFLGGYQFKLVLL